jgi:hypothetical protein
MTLFYLVGGLFCQFGLPVLAAQKWGRRGFVWGNVLAMIATMLLLKLYPNTVVVLEAGWLLVPGANAILVFLSLMLTKFLHVLRADQGTRTLYLLLLPQWLFLIAGIAISPLFPRLVRERDDAA